MLVAAMLWTTGFRAARRFSSAPLSGVPVAAARAAVFTLASTGLAVTGHHLASGQPSPWRNAGVALGLLFLTTLPLSWRLRSLPTVVAVTVGAQLGLHLWLSGVPRPASGSPHTMAGHGGSHGVHDAWHSGQHGVTMAAAHIAAALLVAWCLQRADRACSAVAERLGEVITGFVVRLLPAGQAPLAPRVLRPAGVRAESPPYDSLLLAYAVVRRGPPTEPVPVS